MLDLTPFASSGRYGYSCQALIARRVNEYLHNGFYFCWFSEEFNPKDTGYSSNPSRIYDTLSHAIQTTDVNDDKVVRIREKLLVVLMEAITRDWHEEFRYERDDPSKIVEAAVANPELARAIVAIRHAGLEMFRPQIWRIHLWEVASRASGGQYKFERLVKDLQCEEFEVIIE